MRSDSHVSSVPARRILLGEFKHETNTFCSKKTGLEDFRSRSLKTGQEIVTFFSGTRVEVGGFLDACKASRLDVLPAVAANATPGGLVTEEAFRFVKEALLNKCKEEMGRYDGILLSLHGAMVTETSLDGEGDLLTALREVIGKNIPIVATLDLHANVSQKMVSLANAFFPYKSYPHVDQYDRAYEAGMCMADCLSGKIRPLMRVRRLPIMISTLQTEQEPLRSFYAQIHKWEQDPKVIHVGLLHGFSWADTPDTGMSLLAVTDDDAELAEQILAEVSKDVLDRRASFGKHLTGINEAVEIAMNSASGPVILADLSDNPGGGGTADGTHILRKLIEMKAENVGLAIICDPETVGKAIASGVGTELDIFLGGKVEAREIYGDPIRTRARVKTITDGVFVNKGPMAGGVENHLGRTVVLQIGGIDVIVCEKRTQPWDPEIFRRMGIEPKGKKILVLKSSMHFRAAFGEFAQIIIEVEAPGLLSSNFGNFSYKNLRRPIYPLDDI
jgi:microcystin degradation protein MlrC